VTESPTRAQLISDVLDEMAQFNPASLMRAWQHWPKGRLSLIHLNVLAALSGGRSLAMGELAETLDVSQASATGIVDRMEQRGLVQRTRATEDRRVILVEVTESGRETLAGIALDRRERLAAMLDHLTDEELAGFLLGSRAMRRLREVHQARLQEEASR
jgi:DNA-binding MarR family transcriptional regulator